jgi:CRISPR-associated exonuclease Cas4
VKQIVDAQQEESKQKHIEMDRKDARRKAAIFYSNELQQAEKYYQINFVSQRLKLHGVLDCLIKTDREYIPVDYKYQNSDHGRPHLHHKYQLVAYALLVDERYQTKVKRGFLYYVPEEKPIQVEITYTLKRYLERIVTKIENQLENHVLPPIKNCRGVCGYEWICQNVA